jgi:hypothetical protein
MAGAATGVMAVAAAGTAIAAGDSVKISAPNKVQKGHVLHTTISGHTSGPRSLGYFVAYKKCASNSAKELRRAQAGISYAENGHFSHHVATTPVTKSGYLCAYLQKGALDRFGVPTGAVTARASKHFKVT